ncbi:MAG: hypothetical protein L0H31_06900, partial [Nocardioidaceae bacterium]|nr:hypothetical protein [Nocardioidaceae bacterium]
MAEHQAVLLDTSVLIQPPRNLAQVARSVAVSTISIAELASGLNTPRDPIERSRRADRFAQVLTVYSPLP